MSQGSESPKSELYAILETLTETVDKLKKIATSESKKTDKIPPAFPPAKWSAELTSRVGIHYHVTSRDKRDEGGGSPGNNAADARRGTPPHTASMAPVVLNAADLSLRDFDPLFYLSYYPDLKRAFGLDYIAACRHFTRNGVFEGRSPNIFFDPIFYRSIHPDLANHDNRQLLQHWYLNGVEEGRQGSPFFGMHHYVHSHSDLPRVFGTNYAAAFEHWKRNGHRERRETAPNRILQLYWGDLRTASGGFQVIDETRDCLPEEPVREEPSTGQILGIACKILPHFGIKQLCKKVAGIIVEQVQGTYQLCPENGGPIRAGLPRWAISS